MNQLTVEPQAQPTLLSSQSKFIRNSSNELEAHTWMAVASQLSHVSILTCLLLIYCATYQLDRIRSHQLVSEADNCSGKELPIRIE